MKKDVEQLVQSGAIGEVLIELQGIAKHFMQKYSGVRSMEADDIKQIVDLSIMKSMQTYKPNGIQGCTFGGYAYQRAEWDLIRAFHKDRVVRVPCGVKFNKAETYSIDSDGPDENDETASLPSLLFSDDHKKLESGASDWQVNRMIEEAGLSKREKAILNLRFGLDGEEPMRLKDISQSWGISRERVRQIECQAISKMQIKLGLKKKYEYAELRQKSSMGRGGRKKGGKYYNEQNINGQSLRERGTGDPGIARMAGGESHQQDHLSGAGQDHLSGSRLLPLLRPDSKEAGRENQVDSSLSMGKSIPKAEGLSQLPGDAGLRLSGDLGESEARRETPLSGAHGL